MSHRVVIRSEAIRHAGRLWYIHCKEPSCRWSASGARHSNGYVYFGRESWDATLAVGLAHLKDKCKHE